MFLKKSETSSRDPLGRRRRVLKGIGTDQGATSKAIAAAVPVLLGALARNADHGDGAQQLHDALTRRHDGAVLDDVSGLLGGLFGKR